MMHILILLIALVTANETAPPKFVKPQDGPDAQEYPPPDLYVPLGYKDAENGKLASCTLYKDCFNCTVHNCAWGKVGCTDGYKLHDTTHEGTFINILMQN